MTSQDINGYKIENSYNIPNLKWLLNPFIWLNNKLRKVKVDFHLPISTYKKVAKVSGISAVKAERLLNLHNVIKKYEEKEMKNATKKK